MVPDPERDAADQGDEERQKKRNCCCPTLRLGFVLQRTNNRMESIQVEPNKNINGRIDGEYDGAV